MMAEGELPPFAPEWLAVRLIFPSTMNAWKGSELANVLQAEQMQGGRLIMKPGPIAEVRALFEQIFVSVSPFLPPPTDAVKTGEIAYQL